VPVRVAILANDACNLKMCCIAFVAMGKFLTADYTSKLLQNKGLEANERIAIGKDEAAQNV
jgi:cytochrome c oxidase assembly factor CtaG